MTGLRSVLIADRRGSARLPARASIGLQVGGRSGRVEMCHSRDFSINGVFVETRSGIAVGTAVELFFMPPGSSQSLRLTGHVTRKASDGIGIAFRALSPEQQRSLDRFIDSLKPAVPPPPPPDAQIPDEYDATQIEKALRRSGKAPDPQAIAAHLHTVARQALESGGALEAAIALLKRAVALSPYVPAYHHDLGAALYRSGDVSSAVAELDKALWLEPNPGSDE